MWRYPAPSAALTASRVSSGGVWNTPRPSAGISTPLLRVMVSTESIVGARPFSIVDHGLRTGCLAAEEARCSLPDPRTRPRDQADLVQQPECAFAQLRQVIALEMPSVSTMLRAAFMYPSAKAMPACHGAAQFICGV